MSSPKFCICTLNVLRRIRGQRHVFIELIQQGGNALDMRDGHCYNLWCIPGVYFMIKKQIILHFLNLPCPSFLVLSVSNSKKWFPAESSRLNTVIVQHLWMLVYFTGCWYWLVLCRTKDWFRNTFCHRMQKKHKGVCSNLAESFLSLCSTIFVT